MELSHFPDLMSRLRTGDQGAAFEVFHEFSRRLAGLARTRLQGAIAAKVDPDDVLQSAFRSFFLRHRDGQFEIDDWDELWSLLTVITLRKCGKQLDYFHAACRNLSRESPPPNVEDETFASCQAIARDPTPEESARLVETVETLLGELSSRDRRIVEKTLAGETPTGISLEVPCSERTVERIRARLYARLVSMLDTEES
jgi:RNA polymerase sigma-70 factor (ECF subfamily)